MDKYYGVYVKIALSNGDVVKGYIQGRDEQSNLLLKDTTIEHSNGYSSQESMLPINTKNIKDLQVLEMNPANKPKEQANDNSQQQQQQQQQEMLMKQQIQQRQFQMQQQMMFQQQQQQHYHQQMQQFQQPSPHMHMDPAILFQQQNSPLLPRDPAIISSQDMMYNNKSPSMNNGHAMDPAILFSQSASATPPPNNNLVQQLFQKQQQQHQQQQQQQPSGLKSLDPSALFQSSKKQNNAQSKKNDSPQAPFQDPAILSITSTPAESPKPKKPLFGGKKSAKSVKEVVVFEDYADFEKGKGVVKKANEKKGTDSNTSTPNIKKKSTKNESKQINNKMENLSLNEKPTKTRSPAPTQANEVAAAISTPPLPSPPKQQDKTSPSSTIPLNLIPPRVRRNGSSQQQQTQQPQQPQQPQQQPQQQQKQQQKQSVEKDSGNATRILTVAGGIQIPTINANQMEVAKLIGRETGMTQTQLVENGAFGISTMVLKAIGGHRRIQPDNHNAAPVVVILAGPTAIGESGIAAARHLANRGCQVIISMSEDTYCGATVEQYKKLAKFSGARIVYSLDELPDQYTTPVDIIVDALLGSDMLKVTPAIKAQMNWANNNKAPVLSIEFPSGVNPNDGTPSDSHINPKWTLCIGAPYGGCTSRNVTGELFLADAGLPFSCFEKSIPNFYIPWGSDFVLALEYA